MPVTLFMRRLLSPDEYMTEGSETIGGTHNVQT